MLARICYGVIVLFPTLHKIWKVLGWSQMIEKKGNIVYIF